MQIIKLLFISVIAFALLLTTLALLLPAHVRISRAVDISGSTNEVRAVIARLPEWAQWNEYIMALPDKQFSADSIWSKQLTVSMIRVDSNLVQTKWRQQNGKTFPGGFNLIHQQSITTVQWYFDFSFKWYPWQRFSSITYDRALGPEMEKSLQNLKQLLEKAP